MKTTLFIFALAMISASCAAQTTPRIEQSQSGSFTRARLAGSLEPQQDIGCIRIDDAKATFTAADLYASVTACARSSRYADSAKLFMLAGMTWRFDAERVSDKSVRQSRVILVTRALSELTNEQKEGFNSAMDAAMKSSQTLHEVCRATDRLGPPAYFPKYLVLHGIEAFGKADPLKDALVVGFDEQGKWDELKDKYLHCPRQ